MSHFTLYGTSACHLCEIAEQMLAAEARAGRVSAVEQVDISDSEELFKRYGVRIPVLRHPDGRELDWPFKPEELAAFLLS